MSIMFDPTSQHLMEQRLGGGGFNPDSLPLSSPSEMKELSSRQGYPRHVTTAQPHISMSKTGTPRHTSRSTGSHHVIHHQTASAQPQSGATMVQIGDDFDNFADNSNGFTGNNVVVHAPQYVQPQQSMPRKKDHQRYQQPAQMKSPHRAATNRQQHASPHPMEEDRVMPNMTSSNYSSPQQRGVHQYMDPSQSSQSMSAPRRKGGQARQDINQNWTTPSSSKHVNRNISSAYPAAGMPKGHFAGESIDHMSDDDTHTKMSSWNRSYVGDSSFDTEIPMHVNTVMSSPQSGMQMMSPPAGLIHSPGGQSDMSFDSVPSVFNSPYPPGRAPIEIPVQSPSPSEGSHEGYSSHRVREVRTAIPEEHIASTPPKEKKFLKKVQKELDEQRQQWKSEVDKLTGGMVGMGIEASPNGIAQGSSSFVDTSGGTAIFKATVDVSGYSPHEISVSVDKLINKVVVQAAKTDRTGHPTKTFTQRVQLPRFADDANLRSKLTKTGQLKIEVPLIYYFDNQKKSGRQAKSFVYQVNTGRDGQQRLEILVNTGSGYRARDLKVQVHDENKLVIIGEKRDLQGNDQKKLVKQYSLPALAQVDAITSRLGKDGRLQVNVPLARKEDIIH